MEKGYLPWAGMLVVGRAMAEAGLAPSRRLLPGPPCACISFVSFCDSGRCSVGSQLFLLPHRNLVSSSAVSLPGAVPSGGNWLLMSSQPCVHPGTLPGLRLHCSPFPACSQPHTGFHGNEVGRRGWHSQEPMTHRLVFG